jgi:RNA 2',3'-cyclic 3'-phosphodiesterase
MPERTRVFIAIAIPSELEPELTRLQTELAPLVPNCRWVSSRPFHVTLAFLGDVPNGDLGAIGDAAIASARTTELFDLEVKGLGAFPSAPRPRVVWAGVTAPDLSPLFDLRKSLVRSLAKIGHAPDDDRFHPHVTLGRTKHQERGGPADLTAAVERYNSWSARQFRVTKVEVFASKLGPTGSVYAVLSEAALAGKKTEDLA